MIENNFSIYVFFVDNSVCPALGGKSLGDGVLTRIWSGRLCHRNQVDQLTCFRCGKEIKLGERIHTNGSNIPSSIKLNKTKRMRVYHQDCYESLFIEC